MSSRSLARSSLNTCAFRAADALGRWASHGQRSRVAAGRGRQPPWRAGPQGLVEEARRGDHSAPAGGHEALRPVRREAGPSRTGRQRGAEPPGGARSGGPRRPAAGPLAGRIARVVERPEHCAAANNAVERTGHTPGVWGCGCRWGVARRSPRPVGADASRRANGARGLRPRVARRFAPANTRLERTPAPASKLTSASAAQPRAPLDVYVPSDDSFVNGAPV
jgi:hypothetical protein